ncbi:stalk domain-containing protein [Peptoniphilus lacrimalis]|uniref:stalk domain-containing protein n=1 Tax=Peptoniphilus lacrimalis TaxID=33031 RepID=UPI0023F7EA2B|nr:stalk domain-containing protein [Peptoniphilus lacrimalis]MDK7722656.1 stalk domain-containing protein [Peptoniphilus lacrimalis]MDK7732358.1 stalk domain-containing protein [Peptoniphilus lacrimalis]
MKKLILATLMLMVLIPSVLFAQEKKYEVPVKLVKYGEENKDSMGNKALKQVAEVTEKDGKAHYKLFFRKMVFMNMEGELTNLFIYDSDANSNRVETKQTALDGEYIKSHEFDRNSLKDDKILVAVWVDAMDALAEKGKGGGEQKAYLSFDWANAKEIAQADKKVDAKEEKCKDGVCKKDTSKDSQIKILVNDKEIKSDQAPYINSGRTMVPLRFISEALGQKVDWDAKQKKVTIGENLAILTINSDEIVGKDKTIKIESPAVIKEGRTFVPLRAVAEILGAKVSWDGPTKTVKINK